WLSSRAARMESSTSRISVTSSSVRRLFSRDCAKVSRASSGSGREISASAGGGAAGGVACGSSRLGLHHLPILGVLPLVSRPPSRTLPSLGLQAGLLKGTEDILHRSPYLQGRLAKQSLLGAASLLGQVVRFLQALDLSAGLGQPGVPVLTRLPDAGVPVLAHLPQCRLRAELPPQHRIEHGGQRQNGRTQQRSQRRGVQDTGRTLGR